MNCPKCGAVNPSGARFCNQCGAQLGARSHRRDEGQRRRVVVLFTDISGFTPLSEKMDPEEVRDLIDGCLQRLAEVIYRYEGYVDKFIGDCIMALFGAPITHEDDPLRAVLAALDQMKEIQLFNKERKLDLSLSIGINYGLVATGDIGRPGEYTVMGDVVNLAQRLQYAAPRGSIYASEAVYEQTQNEISYKKLRKIKVKGKQSPVAVYEPQRAKRRFSLRKIQELPLVGRVNELNLLSKLFSEAKSGAGRVVSVVGEAGIGKSKLTFEFKRRTANMACVVEGRGIEYLSTSPYMVVKDIIRECIGIETTDNRDVGAKKVEKFIRTMRDRTLLEVVPFIDYFLGLSMSREDYHRFESMQPKDRLRMVNEALVSFLIALSKQKPLVIIFEDCHWIDNESVNFMRRLADGIAHERILVVNLYRPEFQVGSTGKLRYHVSINLSPLPVDDAIRFMRELLRCETIEDRLVKLLMKQSGCIPFYVHELTLHLVSNSVIEIKNNCAYLVRGRESAVPRTLDELVMAKIDKLDKEFRMIVDIASVVGDEFSVRTLNTLVEFNGKMIEMLQQLVQRGIMQPLESVEPAVSGEERFSFVHSLMREAVYQSLLRQSRREYHRQIGYAIESLYADTIGEYYDALAHHFLHGGEEKKAVEYLEKAGDRKKELYLNSEAIEMYTEALKHIDQSQTTRIAGIHEKLGGLYDLTGRYEKAMTAYEEMQRWGKDEPVVTVKSYIAMAVVLMDQGLFDRALEQLSGARRTMQKSTRVPSHEAKIELANVLRLECWIYRVKGMMQEAEERGREAVMMIKNEKNWQNYENLKRTLELAYLPLAIVHAVKGEYEAAVGLLEDTLLIAEELGDRRALGHAYNNLGTIYRNQGNFVQAVDAYSRKLKISQELGDKSGVGVAYCNLGIVHQNKGDFGKAIDFLEQYLNITTELGDKHGIGQAHVNLGVGYSNMGEYNRAIKSFEKFLAISDELGDKRGKAIGLGNLGEVFVNMLEYKRAIELFKQCIGIYIALGDKKGVASTSYSLACAHVEIGNTQSAEELLKEARGLFEALGNKILIGSVDNAFARLSIKQQQWGKAIECARHGLLLARETGHQELEVYTLINEAIALNGQGDKQSIMQSRTRIRDATNLARKLKNKRLLADATYEHAGLLIVGTRADHKAGIKKYKDALKMYKDLRLSKRVQEITRICRKGEKKG